MAIHLLDLKVQFPAAYADLPAVLARASFRVGGDGALYAETQFDVWRWTGRKWSRGAVTHVVNGKIVTRRAPTRSE